MEINVVRFNWNHNCSFSWKDNTRKKKEGKCFTFFIALST